MKILIFGSNGMLGTYVVSYLQDQGHKIKPLTRKELDVYECFLNGTLYKKLDEILKSYRPIYAINACGIINKRPETPTSEMYIVNGYFPHILSKLCSKNGVLLFHPSTDCVYSGKDGMYEENSDPDCTDDYGASKAIAENINACVIRVSIIGEETNNRSLVEWVKSNKNKTVNGYTNHKWNGITCLEYAKILHRIIIMNDYKTGIFNIASTFKNKNFITKNELIKEISNIYNLNVNVLPHETPVKCDRTLKTNLNTHVSDIRDQIKDMKNYNITLKNPFAT